MVGHDGHRGWVYYLSVDTDHRGRGLARALMSTAEDWLRSRDVVKAQLMVRHSNAQAMGFYERIGYEREGVTVLSRWLDEDAEASARPAAVTP